MCVRQARAAGTAARVVNLLTAAAVAVRTAAAGRECARASTGRSHATLTNTTPRVRFTRTTSYFIDRRRHVVGLLGHSKSRTTTPGHAALPSFAYRVMDCFVLPFLGFFAIDFPLFCRCFRLPFRPWTKHEPSTHDRKTKRSSQ